MTVSKLMLPTLCSTLGLCELKVIVQMDLGNASPEVEGTIQLRWRKKWKESLCSQVILSLLLTPEHLTPSSSYSWVFRNCHLASGLLNSHSLSPLKPLELWETHLTFSWEVKVLGCFRDTRIDSFLAKLRPRPRFPFLRRGISDDIRWTKICPESWKVVTLTKVELN